VSWTKRQIVDQALDDIGLASSSYDLSADQLQSALLKLDRLVASWGSRGIRFGWPMSSSPATADLDTDSGAPDYALDAMCYGLAVALAPGYGKSVPSELAALAGSSLRALILRTSSIPPEMRMPRTMPRGAGQKAWRQPAYPFIDELDEDISVAGDGVIDFD